ncbi:GntR family transcriptional regulator [Sporosarcina sp. NCCP-2222]|uniref:GntR family transcriptional regulator n=1 Tax=Sporosarcina sp. NCCP-2222 TaxID=2935073 RepID=UPI002088099E|nr:GntR family transcriptional regulator [Sporosarcina sp. NCCP-2222]GKV54547.1 GntR family transcriptional regulator [Sporosarcina sp. NCCP-2222]
MHIQIEPASDIPIYTQLANQLIALIAKKELKPNDTLPSVRSLAADLGVNMHTVNKAYHELQQKGIISVIPKSGAVINPIPEVSSESSRDRMRETLHPLIAESIVYGMSRDEILSLASSLISELTEE